MESVICDQVMKHKTENNLFSEKQFGILNEKSTVLHLLVVLDKYTNIIDNCDVIDCICSDFRKAFDTIPHKCLLKKAESYDNKMEMLN